MNSAKNVQLQIHCVMIVILAVHFNHESIPFIIEIKHTTIHIKRTSGKDKDIWRIFIVTSRIKEKPVRRHPEGV